MVKKEQPEVFIDQETGEQFPVGPTKISSLFAETIDRIVAGQDLTDPERAAAARATARVAEQHGTRTYRELLAEELASHQEDAQLPEALKEATEVAVEADADGGAQQRYVHMRRDSINSRHDVDPDPPA